jgi:chromosome segregation and condensation protein ScpB
LIQREELMRLAKIRGKTTYFRVMGELAEWGFIEYRPSRDKGGRSRVRVVEALLPLGQF